MKRIAFAGPLTLAVCFFALSPLSVAQNTNNDTVEEIFIVGDRRA